jgi:hypothetical protein
MSVISAAGSATVWLTLGPVGVWQASAWVIWGRTEVGHLVVQEKSTPWYRPSSISRTCQEQAWHR